jgi:hypothetical protein
MKIFEVTNNSSKTRLGDLCTIKTNYPDADFWVIRRGSENSVGKPTREFNPESIGIKVIKTDIIDPNYLYYMLMYLHSREYFKLLSNGITKLVNIKASDISDIRINIKADSVKNFKYRDFKYDIKEPRFEK